ncbi:MAG TPA: phytanoyl-CoA dioxygenase family protein [Pyrinomonadaceae bacterium]|nr:phytanoyl-CoA dioxygenase family protein [Pyrinomonadaceae bacterium]
MRLTKEFVTNNQVPATSSSTDVSSGVVERLCDELDHNGIVLLTRLIPEEQLKSMQLAFDKRLQRLRWNNFDGYEKTEPYRHMLEDVLLLDQGFLDLAIHPIVKAVVRNYVGGNVELTEARGWRSLPTKRDFHGWHGDAWYDQEATTEIPRELKLAFYLTDVRSGAFNYIAGSQRRQHPRPVPNLELKNLAAAEVVEMMGPAGTAFMFDTSGIHRQGVPMLERRHAVFFNYHDPQIQLQDDDRKFYRYHPLLLNAAFLGNLSSEDQKLLGFGNKTNFIPAYIRPAKPPFLYNTFVATLNLQLHARSLRERIVAKLNHLRSRA